MEDNAELEMDDLTELRTANLLILIIGEYFEQKDLADTN